MTAYELNTRSSSPWIDVFTTDEWISFAHLWNVNFYYCSGYVSPLPQLQPHPHNINTQLLTTMITTPTALATNTPAPSAPST